MFLHRKELIQPVNVGTPDVNSPVAPPNCSRRYVPKRAPPRCNIGSSRFMSRMPASGTCFRTLRSRIDQASVRDAPLFKLKGGGPHFLDSQGSCWTAAYIQEGGNVVRDLRANISAEAGARQTYESLIKACEDQGTKKTLHHLLTREITHANMFMKALDSMGKLDDPFFGNIPPDETVKLVFNLSQGEDVRGPWNEEPDFEYVADPHPEGGLPLPPINADDEGHNSQSSRPRKK
jgi:manganese catalase